MAKSKFTKEQINDICSKYQEGKAIYSLAEEFDTDWTSIRYWLIKAGVYIEKRKPIMDRRKSKKVSSIKERSASYQKNIELYKQRRAIVKKNKGNNYIDYVAKSKYFLNNPEEKKKVFRYYQTHRDVIYDFFV